MPDNRRMMDPGPNDPITPELLRQWNPGAPQGGMGLDPAYSDRYLLDEGGQDTLGNLIQSFQGGLNRTENIDAGLGRLQGLQEEQKVNLQPLWDSANTQQEGPGLLDQLRGGLGSIGGALSNGLDAITPSQGTVDNIAMRLQNAHAIGTGRAPLWMQQQEHQMQLGQQQELMQMRRAQVAQQLQQQQMMKQQKDEDQALGIWKDHQMPIAMKKKLSQQLAAQGNVLAGNLHRLGDEQLVAEMDSLSQYLPKGKMDELSKLMQTPNADLEHVERWVNFAREKKKVIGDRQMKSERFSDLLGRYNAGEIDPSHPDYDEFKQGILEREKAQQENTEMRMKLEQMGLTKKKAEQELAANSVMPQYGPEVNLPGGNVQRDKYDPQTGQLSQVTGNKPPASVTNVNMKQESAFEGELGKENVKDIKATQVKARDAASIISTIHQGRNLLDSGMITGVGAEYVTKFGQALQQAGFTKGKDAISNTQAFTATMANSVAKQIKEFGAGTGLSDADRDYAVKMAGGDITLDEKSIRKILDMNETAARNIIKTHNKSVKGIKSMIPLNIEEPAEYKNPRQLSKEEFDFATQLKKQGMNKEQVLQEIQKRRGR